MSKVAKGGLKFVKKRVAGHKRSAEDIEDEAYERELAIQAARDAGLTSNVHPSHQMQTVLPPKSKTDEIATTQAGVPEDQTEKKLSEDWELFNKLLGKVESTVQLTVQTIEKVKESSVVQDIDEKERESQVVVPEYKGVKSFEEAKREKEEREREALKQRRAADDWERAFESGGAKKQVPDVLFLSDPTEQPQLSFAHYSPSSGPSAIPKTPIEVDPFDTTFISPVDHQNWQPGKSAEEDPFDTKKIDKEIEAVDKKIQRRMSLSGSVNSLGHSAGYQDDPNPRVRPPSRPTAGSSLFSSTECSPVDIPDEVQNFFKTQSRRSSTNPFDPAELVAPQPLSTEDTIRTGAALLQAIASEFVNKDDDDDDLFNKTLAGKGPLPPPSPISPFSEPEKQMRPMAELMSIDNTFGSSASKATESSVDPFTASGVSVRPLPLAPQAVPTAAPTAVPVDAFQLAFGKKSIDLDDVPPQAQTKLPPEQVPQALQSVKDSFDPFKDVQRRLELPTSVQDPVSGAPTPGSDLFEQDLRQQEEVFFGSKAPPEGPSSSEKAPQPTGAILQDRQQSAPHSGIMEGGNLPGNQRENFAKDDTNPFSPKNSPPTEDIPFKNASGVADSFDAPPATSQKNVTSPEDPPEPKAAPFQKFSAISERRVSQDSNPFSPTSTLSPATVGVNNPFGEDAEQEQKPVSFSSAFIASSAPKIDAGVPKSFMKASADPFDTSSIIPATDQGALDAFASKFAQAAESATEMDAFGGAGGTCTDISGGFGEDQFQTDSDFLGNSGIPIPQVPDNTPVKKANLGDSKDSFDDDDEEEHMKITIRPRLRKLGPSGGIASLAAPPKLVPPPKSPSRQAGYQVQPDRFNPFDKGALKTAKTGDEQLFNAFEDVLNESKADAKDEALPPAVGESGSKQAQPLSPSTPLYDEDTTQPLPEWKPKRDLSEGWEFYLRWPNKKKFTGNRYWKPVFVKFSDTTILWIMNKKDDSDPIQEVPLQGCYSLSDMAHQPLDQFKKIFTIKLQYTFFKETVGVRKGQIAKVISGQVNSMGSVAKLGLPLQHASQLTQLLKLGTPDLETIRTFVQAVEDVLFGLQIHRDRALTYKAEEIQAMVVDEYVINVDKTGHVCSQKARVRLFLLAFVSGMPDVEVGINELSRQGKEIVGRYDIMPIVTEEWIRVEDYEFHSCVDAQEFENNKIIKVRPPDATFFELMRFRVRPPRQRELPIQLTAVLKVNSTKVQLKAEVLVPGYSSRKRGQIPCENIAMFFPIPECWVYLFRVEKHFRYGALKSTNRRHGKIKGLERIMGAAAGGNLDKQLIEVTAGQAKYEPTHKAIVWRTPRLPKEGQGAYTQQLMTVDLELTSFDQIPAEFDSNLRVEFTMPASTVSHTTIRSISCPTDADLPVEKYCRYVARHEYSVEMDVQIGSGPNETTTDPVTRVEAKEPVPGTPPMMVRHAKTAGSDSDYSD